MYVIHASIHIYPNLLKIIYETKSCVKHEPNSKNELKNKTNAIFVLVRLKVDILS